MAQTQTPLSGPDQILSLKGETAIYQAFDSYPWKKDQAFLSGLYAILGNPDSQRGSASDITTHARIFFYAQKIGVNIDFASYQTWLSNHPEHTPPDLVPEEYRSPSNQVQQPEWQQAAPKAELFVDKSAAAPAQDPGSGPAYPMGLAEMIKLVQEGKPVPGIRQIPNTIVRDPSVKPVGSMKAPRKPWEKAAPEESLGLEATGDLDVEFPPIEGDSEALVDIPRHEGS